MNASIHTLTDIEKINIEKIEAVYGSDYVLTNRHDLMYNCPYCEEKRGKADYAHKFGVNAKTGEYFCFKCHTRGVLFKDKTSHNEKIIPYLFDYFNDEEEVRPLNKANENMLSLENAIPIVQGSVAYKYLKDRKITDDQINYYNLMSGINDDFGRIIIPNMVVVKWTDFYQGRSFLGAKNKYKNPEGIDKTNIVFNLHNQKKNQDKVYIVEGVFSAIRGGKDCLSIYGSSVSNVQIELIKNYNFKEIYCCLDGDEAGQLGQTHLMNELLKNTESVIYNVKLPETEDPADMGEDIFKEYCEKHKRVFISNKLNNILTYFD